MRKSAFCICENKDADQLSRNREADQRLCFRYTDRTIPLLPKSEISSICGCTPRFVSDLVGNPEDRFSHNEAQLIFHIKCKFCKYLKHLIQSHDLALIWITISAVRHLVESTNEQRHEKTCFAYGKTKTQISYGVTTQLNSAFVFTT